MDLIEILFSRISVRAQLDTIRELSVCTENDEDEKIIDDETKEEANT